MKIQLLSVEFVKTHIIQKLSKRSCLFKSLSRKKKKNQHTQKLESLLDKSQTTPKKKQNYAF